MNRYFFTMMLVGALVGWAGTARAAQPPPGVAELAKGNNAFAWDMYGRLKGEEGNLFFSPYSLRTALGMTCAGALGETAAEMRKTLRFTLQDDALHAAFAATAKGLMPGEDGGYKLSVANSLWGQQGFRWLAPFLEITKTYYGAGLHEVDFTTVPAAEAARGTINGWVEDKTNTKIRNLVPPRALDPNPPSFVRLVLVNAIWFKGDWLEQFDPKATKDEPFYVHAAKKVIVPMMHRRGKGYRYGETDAIHILELPYKGDNLSMVVLLPKAKDGLQRMEEMLTAEKVNALVERLSPPMEVDVYLPTFKMTWEEEMSKPFSAMGMVLPFDQWKADFSGMNGAKPPDQEALHIARIFHKAFVEVNEKGTEAAAATAIVMMRLSCAPSPPPLFRADHPFVFLIREKASGNILFLGRLVDPS